MGRFCFFCLVAALFISNLSAGQKDSVTTGYIIVPDGKLYYEETGQGDETIVFIHDGLVPGEVWDNQFSAFAEEYRIIRYDRRGYGHSPQPEKKYFPSYRH